MHLPRLIETATDERAVPGLTYKIEGELVPVLHVAVSGLPVYFEHHVLLWKSPSVGIGLKPLAGAFKRMLAGMPIFMTHTEGDGHIAFSRDGAGHVFALHLRDGQQVDVREHQFLAASDNVEYSFQRVKGLSNMLFGGTGFFIDSFRCARGEGVLWLHGYGNVFEMTLPEHAAIDVEPGGWLFKDPSVRMETVYQGLKTGFFASAGNLAFNRFHGPGRLAIQSMYMHMPTTE